MTGIADIIPFANLAEIMQALVFVMVLRLYHAVQARAPRVRDASARIPHT